MSAQQIAELEQEIFTLSSQLAGLRKAETGTEVADYSFETLEGAVSLRSLFAGKKKLLAIHNMGQACRYCTLWGDGLNPFLSHLETAVAVVLLSKDDPATQRLFANSRGWRFRMASHGGGDYIREQSTLAGHENVPGMVSYELRDDKIFRMNACVFGPMDLYCSMWHILGLAGLSEEEWTPQYNYWRRPEQMDDGGENVLD
jgi:predicted dithiol-disulfide oxidoreductase (DUF899 family)